MPKLPNIVIYHILRQHYTSKSGHLGNYTSMLLRSNEVLRHIHLYLGLSKGIIDNELQQMNIQFVGDVLCL